MKSFIVLLEHAETILSISGEYCSDVDVTVTRDEDFVLTAGVKIVLFIQTIRKSLMNIVERWEGFRRRKIGLNSLAIFILWTRVRKGQTEGSFNLETYFNSSNLE